VTFKSVLALSEALKRVLEPTSEQSSLRTLLSASETILELVWSDVARYQKGSEMEWCIHLCAVTVQFLCVGFLSYSQAHIGPFQPFFLDSPLHQMTLSGLDWEADFPQLIAELVDLTCLGEMTGGPVLIFRASQGSSQPRELEKPQDLQISIKYDILGHIEDILDTWGPGSLIFLSDLPALPVAIKIGKGFIFAGNGQTYHWSKDIQDIED
jgi:hypothetical protein